MSRRLFQRRSGHFRELPLGHDPRAGSNKRKLTGEDLSITFYGARRELAVFEMAAGGLNLLRRREDAGGMFPYARLHVCKGEYVQMKRAHCVMAAVGGLVFAASAQASTVRIAVSGNGITANVTLTLGADLYAGPLFGTGTTPNPTGPGYFGLADPINALSVTGAVGTFSDANLGLSNVAITGYVANNYLPHFDNDQTIPFSFSWYTGVGFPAGASTLLSYDNLFYTGAGAPITCLGVLAGGIIDDYGLLLTLANGDVFDVWSDGGSGDMIYGAAVATSSAIIDYQDPYPGNPAWGGARRRPICRLQ